MRALLSGISYFLSFAHLEEDEYEEPVGTGIDAMEIVDHIIALALLLLGVTLLLGLHKVQQCSILYSLFKRSMHSGENICSGITLLSVNDLEVYILQVCR